MVTSRTPSIHFESTSPLVGSEDAQTVIAEEPEETSEEAPTVSTPTAATAGSRPASRASGATNSRSSTPTPVFAPRPVRMPPPIIYRPIPVRKPGLLVEDSNSASRSTPPPSVPQNFSIRSGSASPAKHHQRRRSSSASTQDGAWNFKSMVLTESRLQGGETSEVHVRVNDDGDDQEAEEAPMPIYSPSRDILEELYKIVRNNKTPSYTGINIPRTPSSGPSSQFPFSTVHRRHLSDASNTSDGRTKSPASRDGNASPKFTFPGSPISRAVVIRNPIIVNSRFNERSESPRASTPVQ